MLSEKPNVSQNPREGIRRWFADAEMELVTWQKAAGAPPDAFHLCYKIHREEFMLVWRRESGFDHGKVGSSERDPTRNNAPHLVKDRPFDRRKVMADFVARAGGIESLIADHVTAQLLEYGETPVKKTKRDVSGPAPSFPSPSRGGASIGSGGTRGGKGPAAAPAPVARARPAPVRVQATPEPARSDGRLTEDLMKKVRMIEITTRKMVTDVMTGQFRTHFKGHGVQFSEHRQYVAGDDVRHIDWKATARARDPLVKKFEEERELTVMLVVDISGSGGFGSTRQLKSEMAAEIGGMLAYAAVHTGDKVGAMLFAGSVEKIIRPKKGRQHVLRIVRDLLARKATTRGTDLKGALNAAGRIMKHTGVVFIVSDFLAEDYDIALKRLARRHDVVAVHIGDERESAIPEIGQLILVDPETGEERTVDTSSYAFKKWLEEHRTAHETDTETAMRGGRVEQLRVLTKEDYGDAVVRFFRARSRKRR